MNMKKIISSVAAVAMTASLMAVAANATNWANASYADDNPDTVKVISLDENQATFTATSSGAQAKLRITAGELVEDPSLIKSATWTVTYNIPEGTPAGNGVGGGCYFGGPNSAGYWISPDYDEDGNAYWANTTYTAEDSVKILLPTQVPTAESEFVFIDWSSHEAITDMTVTISDLKFFDENGNEIAQKAYAGAADTTADTTADAPAADTTATTSTATGNTTVAAIASVMAVAGAAAIAAKKRK